MSFAEQEGPAGAIPTIDVEPVRVRFPAYDLADSRFRHEVFEVVMRSDPLLGQIKIVDSEHAGPIRSVGGNDPFDSVPKLYSADASIAVDDIESMNFAVYAAMVRRAADDMMQTFSKSFFSYMGELTTHIGNAVEHNGKSLFDQFKEGMMKVALDFDDAGNLVPKQLVIPPGWEEEARAAMQRVFADPEVRARILSERDTFLASRGQRRLLSPF